VTEDVEATVAFLGSAEAHFFAAATRPVVDGMAAR
jgi:hypothetical protein